MGKTALLTRFIQDKPAALEYVFKLAEQERAILVIDEYPYVARSSKSLASTLC